MVRSESVMASKDKTDLIYGVSVSFPLQDPLSDVIQYLKLPFENPIEIRDTRFGFVAYFFMFIAIAGIAIYVSSQI